MDRTPNSETHTPAQARIDFTPTTPTVTRNGIPTTVLLVQGKAANKKFRAEQTLRARFKEIDSTQDNKENVPPKDDEAPDTQHD